MSTVKIVFVTKDKQIVVYGQGLRQLWQVESYVLEHLGEVLTQMDQQIERANIRKYWIDEEGDQVEILNDVDYDFFLKRAGHHRTPKIYFEAIAKPAPEQESEQARSQTQTQSQPNTENLSVHETVSCDVCYQSPIVGFRYKCLECNNYDICMKCEGEMKHKDHLMLRIPTYSSLSGCPAAAIFGSRRRQKKYAAAAAAAASGEEGAPGEGKPRHYRHHRRHCGGNGSGVHHIFSNFYDMMQGLAEGGSAPQTSSAPESPEKATTSSTQATVNETVAEVAAAAAAAYTEKAASNAAAEAEGAAAAGAGASTSNTQSKETNTSPDRSAPNASASAPPSLENLQNFIDPQFMKAGIQILNNFSEMFGKMLDPAVTTDSSRPSSSGSSVAANIDLTGSDSRPASNATPNESNKGSAAVSGEVTPMEAEVTSPHTPAPSPRADENDWTMIDNTVPGVVLPDAVTSSSSTDPVSIAAAVASASPSLDYVKLSQQLQSHIENEKNTPVPVVPSPQIPTPALAPAVITLPAVTPIPLPPPVTVQTQTPAPTSVPSAPAQGAPETRAVAVYHPDPRINTAVHAMMAMGFSNEGAMLTQLLASVNGDIPLALDLMTNAQRT